MNPTKAQAILSLVPNAEFILRGDELNWLDSRPQPSEAEIEAELQRLIAEHPYKEIEALRSAAYRTEADPLFFKYQVGEVTKDEWIAKREEIRARYPYPS
jgi:predicted metal-dependent phosphoesterase TrpH